MDAALRAKVERALAEHKPPALEVEFAGHGPWTFSKIMVRGSAPSARFHRRRPPPPLAARRPPPAACPPLPLRASGAGAAAPLFRQRA
jgi:hypothetical protein